MEEVSVASGWSRGLSSGTRPAAMVMTKPATTTTTTVARMATMKIARLSGFFSPECSSGLLADSAVCPSSVPVNSSFSCH